jgi:hypothetical protein
LISPEARWGELFVLSDQPFERGVSQRLNATNNRLPVYVDRSQGWVEMCSAVTPKAFVRILPGVIFQIGAGGEFSALWLQPQSGIG